MKKSYIDSPLMLCSLPAVIIKYLFLLININDTKKENQIVPKNSVMLTLNALFSFQINKCIFFSYSLYHIYTKFVKNELNLQTNIKKVGLSSDSNVNKNFRFFHIKKHNFA